MCWLHASANAIQYWQSYYGVFAKPQTGNYYDHSSNTWKNNAEKPLPYGRIGTEDAAYGDSSNQVPDARRLEVARDIYKNMDNNQGGTFKWASEWFFRGTDEWPSDNAQGYIWTNNTNTGGYYSNYFGSGSFFKEDLSYTTEYSVARDSIAGVHHSGTDNGNPEPNSLSRADNTTQTPLIHSKKTRNTETRRKDNSTLPLYHATLRSMAKLRCTAKRYWG